MKNKILLYTAFGLFGSLAACSKHEIREQKYPTGQIEEQFSVMETDNGSFIKDGEYKKWYINGQMKIECSYVKDSLNGEYKEWYENGKKKSEGAKKMGKDIGALATWYEDGKKSAEMNYTSDGVKDGTWNYWDKEGKLYATRTFKDGADVNLPAKYKGSNGDILELNPNGTYKRVTHWETTEGKFEILNGKLEMGNYKTPMLKISPHIKKYRPDTIVVVYGDFFFGGLKEVSYNKETDIKSK